MAETEFKVFAQKLATYFQGNDSPEEFTRMLFTRIYFNPKGDSLLHDMEARTLRGYFYGEHDITILAKKINKDLDSQYFEEFIDTETDDTIKGLCAAFADECPGINNENFKNKIAERFKEIICNAATIKRKRKKRTELVPQSQEKTVVATIPTSIKEQYGALLVAEERSVCPNDGCSTPLFVNVGGQLGVNYEVTIIDPSVSETKMENLIALCPACHSKYITGRTDEQVQRLLHIKKNLVDDYEAKETVSMQKIEDGIRKVLEKIPKMQVPANIDLNYNPVTLRQKIAADNLMLYLKAKTNVNVYYSAVQDAFTELNEERILRYKPFCLQVRMTYMNLNDMGLSQDEIFEKMVDWLQDATHENRSSCEVIISYFIQKCEVFDAIWFLLKRIYQSCQNFFLMLMSRSYLK